MAGEVLIRRVRIIGLLAVIGASLAVTPAAADTLAPRDTPFTAAQAPADQYTTPTPQLPSNPTPTAQPSVEGVDVPGSSRGDDDGAGGEGPAGGTAPDADGPGVAPADVEGATTSPREADGTLPFTGGDLLALVWIALALLAAGTLGEIVRRRLEARRTAA